MENQAKHKTSELANANTVCLITAGELKKLVYGKVAERKAIAASIRPAYQHDVSMGDYVKLEEFAIRMEDAFNRIADNCKDHEDTGLARDTAVCFRKISRNLSA